MLYKAFKEQIAVHKSQARIRGVFCGKRCISPESKVLTLDGVKSFGDISSSDYLLSFDQKANQYQFHRSSASFPKTKSKGLRLIHERGEFVASEHHLVFCADYKYRSVQEIQRLLSLGNVGLSVTLLSHQNSIEELDQLLCSSSDHYLIQRLSDYLGHCAYGVRQYGQQLLKVIEAFPILFQQIFGARVFDQLSYQEAFGYVGVQGHKILEYNHHDQHIFRRSMRGVLDLSSYPSFVVEEGLKFSYISGQFLHEFQLDQIFFYLKHLSRNICEYHSIADQLFSSCHSRIVGIEEVSSRWWWDISVEKNNNYFSNGAIHHNSGKTELGAIEAIRFTEQQIGYNPESKDPYLGVIIAPTDDMLRRLSLAKFFLYAKPFKFDFHQTFKEITWHNGSKIYGISAEKPKRLEGLKANWVWIDEVFQCSEALFLEARARVSDSKGHIICTGSLGVQYTNPKQHWVYKHFKDRPTPDTEVFEWSTRQNPYVPKEELDNLRDTLDPRTYRQMFEIDWNVPGNNLVYDEFDEANIIRGYQYDPRFETYISVDWGWNHPMACLFFQRDPRTDTVYLFDEIVSSKLKLEQLWERIKQKGYNIKNWCCDIAGNQEREQTGISNINWFKQPPRNIHFKYRSTAVQYGIPIVRSYIKNGLGQRRFFIDEVKCPKSVDNMRNYSYQEKNGIVVNENPLKENDDCVDSIRYFFVNFLDYNIDKQPFKEFDRWKL